MTYSNPLPENSGSQPSIPPSPNTSAQPSTAPQTTEVVAATQSSESIPSPKKSKNQLIIGIVLVLLLLFCICIALFLVSIRSINPAENFQSSRDAERKSETAQIMNALSQYEITSLTRLNGREDISGNTIPVCTSSIRGKIFVDDSVSKVYEYDLDSLLVPEYIAAIPEDPDDKKPGGDSGYTICKNGDIVTISAPNAEGEEINTSR